MLPPWLSGKESACRRHRRCRFDPPVGKFPCMINLLLVVLGLRCCTGFSLAAVSRGCSPVAMPGLLIAAASLVAEHKL